eukprot:UN25539
MNSDMKEEEPEDMFMFDSGSSSSKTDDDDDGEFRPVEKDAHSKYVGIISMKVKKSKNTKYSIAQLRRRCTNLKCIKRMVDLKEIIFEEKNHAKVLEELNAESRYISCIVKTKTTPTGLSFTLPIRIQRAANKCTVKIRETLRYLSSSTENLTNAIKESQMITDVYKKKKLKTTLQGLLDFACRGKMNKSDYLTEGEMNGKTASDMYGLNISLHDYQIQSVSWMMRRERSTSGAYGEFAKKITTADNLKRNFYYSPDFEIVSFDKHPRVNGGILCEEMGLGKTIE